MAGKPVGTCFASIDLDSTKLEQGLKKVNEQLVSGSIKVEDAYKSLGLKSDQVYNMMRANAFAAVDFIKNKTLSSKEEIIRAEQAAADKITRINDQQFGKQTSLLDKLKQNWIAASAAIVAAGMLVNKAMAYMDVGAKALQVESSFKIMADAAGVNAESMIASMKKATKETIDDSDLMQKAVKLMTLGYDPSQIERFSAVVITASQIAGVTAVEAFDQLGDAIANRMPKALVRMGAVTREQMKIVNEAITAGADSTALYELAMANLELKQKMLQGTQDAATISLQRFHAQQKETTESIGKGLIVVLQSAYGSFQYLAAGCLGLVSAFARLDAAIYSIRGKEEEAAKWTAIANDAWAARNDLVKKATANISGLAEVGEKATAQEIADSKAKVDAQMKELAAFKDTEAAAKKALQEREAAEKAIVEAMRKANIEIEGIGKSQYEKDLIRIDSEAAKFRTAKADEINIVKFTETERALIIAKSNEAIKVLREKAEDEFILSNYKRLEEQTKAIQDAKDSDVKIYLAAIATQNKSEEEFILANYKRLEDRSKADQEYYEKQKKLSIERITLEAGLYADLKGYGNEYYEAQKRLIEQRIKDLKEAGVDAVAIKDWETEETWKADKKKLLSSDKFFDGMKAGLIEEIKNQKTGAELMQENWKDFENRRKQFSNEFVDNFIAGQDLMLSVQKAAGNMAVNLAGDISKRMWAAAIDRIVGMIGAHIGGGAALVAWQGANKGGVAGALTEIGIFLGSGVAAMLAGRAMAQKFKAEGGWVGTHPGGGWVREGSGNQDDVFLGYTPGVRHWGMGGEFVTNKESARKHAPLLEAINRDRGWDEGGSIDPDAWKPVSQSLGIGCGMSFLHGFLTKGGFWGGITEAIAFNATAIPSMFAGKYLSNQFKADGGWMDVGHGWGSFFSGLISPFHAVTSALSSAFNATISNIPGLGQYAPNPFRLGEIFTDPKEAERVLRNLIQGPYEQIAKDVMTPGKYWSDPINTVTSNITNLGKVWKEFTGAKLPFFHSGIDFVPQTGPAYLERGEKIVSREENMRERHLTINIPVILNGREIGKVIYNETKSGNKMIHDRGITSH